MRESGGSGSCLSFWNGPLSPCSRLLRMCVSVSALAHHELRESALLDKTLARCFRALIGVRRLTTHWDAQEAHLRTEFRLFCVRM